MNLLNTTADLKAHVSGVQLNMKSETVLAYFEQVDEKYIIPAIGELMYAELTAAPFSALSPENQLLHHKLARASAFYTILEALPSLDSAIGDFGLVNHNTENMSPVSKWRYQNRLQDSSKKGDYWLEQAMRFLETKQENYKTWILSPDFFVSNELLLRSATETTIYYPALQSRRSVYQRIKPFVPICEQKYLKDEISAGLFAYLKGLIVVYVPPPLSAEDDRLLRYVRLYLAEMVMYEAHFSLFNELTETGFRSLFTNDASSYQQDQAASETQATAFRERSWNNAQSHRRELRKYLDETASDTLYPDYYNSSLYPVVGVRKTTEQRDNSNRNSFMM